MLKELKINREKQEYLPVLHVSVKIFAEDLNNKLRMNFNPLIGTEL